MIFKDVTVDNKRRVLTEDLTPPGFTVHNSGSCYLNTVFTKTFNIVRSGKVTVEWSERLNMVRIKFTGKGALNNGVFGIPSDIRREMNRKFQSSALSRLSKPTFRLTSFDGVWYKFKMFNEQKQKFIELEPGIELTEEEKAIYFS